MIEIPEMTDEMGRYWDQPNRSEILVDDKYAIMTKATFKKLANYEHSHPSGIYDGKMWRCGTTLLWYGPSENLKLCSINRRLILIVEG